LRVRETLLVAGGLDANGNALSSLELFDPSIEDWRSLGDQLFYPRVNHTATLVLDGGFTSAFNSAEIFTEATGSWTRVGRSQY
jgi:hypothetical protein